MMIEQAALVFGYSQLSVSTENWFQDLWQIPKSPGAQIPQLALHIHICRFSQFLIMQNCSVYWEKICKQVDSMQFKLTLFKDQLYSIMVNSYKWYYQIKRIKVQRFLLCSAKSLHCVQLFGTAWTVALKAPLSIGFSRQEYWSGLPFLLDRTI